MEAGAVLEWVAVGTLAIVAVAVAMLIVAIAWAIIDGLRE